MTQVLLIAALREELDPFFRRIAHAETPPVCSGVRSFALEGRAISVVICGVGGARAAETLAPVLDRLRPDWALLAGWAGALTTDLDIDQCVVVTQVHRDQPGVSPETLPVLPDSVPELLGSSGFRFGEGITVDRMICRRADRERLHRESGASVVDMETHDVARLMRERSIPLMVMRIVSDPADESIGVDFDRIPEGRVLRAAYFAAHPGEYQRLRELKARLGRTAERLADRIEEVLAFRQVIERA